MDLQWDQRKVEWLFSTCKKRRTRRTFHSSVTETATMLTLSMPCPCILSLDPSPLPDLMEHLISGICYCRLQLTFQGQGQQAETQNIFSCRSSHLMHGIQQDRKHLCICRKLRLVKRTRTPSQRSPRQDLSALDGGV